MTNGTTITLGGMTATNFIELIELGLWAANNARSGEFIELLQAEGLDDEFLALFPVVATGQDLATLNAAYTA